MTLRIKTLSIMTLHNDTQHNDIQHKNIQHNDTQHKDTQHKDIQRDDIQHTTFSITINKSRHSRYLHNTEWCHAEYSFMVNVIMLNIGAPYRLYDLSNMLVYSRNFATFWCRFDGRMRTPNLKILRQVFYHCTTGLQHCQVRILINVFLFEFLFLSAPIK